MQKTLIVGLTGGIGSGKSAAMAYFEQLEVPCIDADIVAREVVEPGSDALETIARKFGPEVILSNGNLDRARLRQIVFAEPQYREWLERLLHPLINQRIRDWLQACQAPYCILSSPLLLETQQVELVDRVLLIDIPEEVQVARTTARDGNSETQVKAIMAAQSSRAFKQSKADDIICNDQDLRYLESEIGKLHQQYMQLATALH